MPEDLRTLLERWLVQLRDRADVAVGMERRGLRIVGDELADMLRAAGGAPVAEPPGWQPIETAPRDRAILLWEGAAQCATVGWWCDRYLESWHAVVHGEDAPWNDSDPAPTFMATHWMPLPAPPRAAPAPEKEAGKDIASKIRAAWRAGFEASGEGFNGEYLRTGAEARVQHMEDGYIERLGLGHTPPAPEAP